jgi:alpha-ribazole phosphatase
MYMGDWEMQAFDDINDPQLLAWYRDWLHVPARNGESYQDLLARVSSFLNEVKESAKTSGHRKIALFAHGGVLLCARILAGAVRREKVPQQLPAYGEIIRISI